MCWINPSFQNSLKFSPVKPFPRPVLFLFGKPFVAIYSSKKSITLSADGFEKKASDQPDLLSTETSRYFFWLYAFWIGSAKSSEISSFGWIAYAIFLYTSYSYLLFVSRHNFWPFLKSRVVSMATTHQMPRATWQRSQHAQSEWSPMHFRAYLWKSLSIDPCIVIFAKQYWMKLIFPCKVVAF